MPPEVKRLDLVSHPDHPWLMVVERVDPDGESLCQYFDGNSFCRGYYKTRDLRLVLPAATSEEG